ncbi:ABC transporter permease [Actinosynnema sp. NPDC047251]|uniref:Putative exporter of polyketide antibiotics n=1 Tax=Saccharothrix espanaensis (strain ATCC 51144 / DSM 44229 / JCM 9112 / NBRC 15066 / NRRL 15764) TaxID=1179773 RepID=K0JWM4_SACES|nr:exporter of polyketide antibiotics [Saccharothrix espanaensis]CCH30451.1 putative exporter of polyketide antibiotics [Saccharothrix espanaensis DSM 44229]
MTASMGTGLVGTGHLVRLALRRDRLLLPVWVVGLVGTTLATASGMTELYGTQALRQQMGATAGANPAFLAMLGPIYDYSTIGGILAWRWGVFGALLTGLMAMFLVTRHTRAEEETGRLELIGSTVTGRHAPLAAGVAVSALASLLIGLLVGAGLTGLGEAASGSFALGLAFTAAGLVFAGVGAVTAQLTESARTANALSGAVLGVAYLLRAVGDAAGDAGPTWLTWLSPIGWLEQVRAFAGDRWWVFLLSLALAAVLVGAASALVTRRDHGGGLLPTRLGPARAPASLGSAFGLAWRLQRGMLLGWTLSLFVLGGVYGAVARGVEQMLEANPALEQVISQLGGTGAIVDVYLASVLGIIGLFSAIYVVQATLRLRSEESDFRAEPVLATSVRRGSWVASHLVFATVGAAVVLAAAGLGAGLVHGARVGDLGGQVGRLVGAALAHVPAVWVVAGITLALFGLVPKLTAVSWAFLVVFLVLGQLGPLLGLDRWAMDLSPFTHIPKVPGADLSAGPLVWLTVTAVALVAAGFAGFRRRDIG